MTIKLSNTPSSNEIRQAFLDYFSSKGHQIVASSSLVPHGDPTLLFTNAGMNQFKDVFLGFDKRPYTRATTSQKCVRAGGKHNDLENVGYTARHHTFFEMLGNFSFGDYFKEDAIAYAWELLTEVFKLPKDKLTVTVYADDDEAYNIWHDKIGVPAEHIIRIGDNKGARYASDNFWMMGDTGPCGPCTEIFYDHGDHHFGGPPGSPDEDGDRFIEIWNNVFMQFNRDEAGVMHPLPKPSVDTGMGLERISAVLQHVHANYEIDIFQGLIAAAARETNTTDLSIPSLKVLADHIRACSFLIADGVIPGNEGRGYVLRRIIRRAIRHGYKLGARNAFFHKLVPDLVKQMGEAYPELVANQSRIMDMLKLEEDRFFETIENGMAILEDKLDRLDAIRSIEGYGAAPLLDGELAFKLHDTFGFPLDLTADVCRERNISVDTAAFNTAMTRQKEQARAAGKFKMDGVLEYTGADSMFMGYETLKTAATITAIYVDSTPINTLKTGESGIIVLDCTPFYAESGGQVGDIGLITEAPDVGFGENGVITFKVTDTQKIKSSVIGHHGNMAHGQFKVGDLVYADVFIGHRSAIMRNHSATHLMHKALRETLGEHVQQKGSLVDADKTRFDFVHNAPMTDAEIAKVEAIVNAEILANATCQARVMDIESAQKTGAMMLFGEKYGNEVRVLDIGSSRELCGGTHVSRTGDIGLFKITGESGVAAGVRRVEATTGNGALKLINSQQALIAQLSTELKAPTGELANKVAQLSEHAKSLEKELARLKSKLASSQGDDLAAQAVDVNGVKVLSAMLEGADASALRETMDKLKDKLKSAAIVLASVNDGKVSLAAGVTADLTAKVKAGDLVNFVALQVGGKGGGKPDMAMAGGTDASGLPKALASVKGWVTSKIG
ncbi:MAG: alanine--tRNA ligase [Methylotenera sp.]